MKTKNSEFTQIAWPAFQTLSTLKHKKVNAKILYAVKRSNKPWAAAVIAFNEAKKEALEARCLRDKDNNPIIESGSYTYESPEVKAEAIKAVNDLLDMDIEVETHGVSINEFDGLEILDESTTITGSDGKVGYSGIDGRLIVCLGDFILDPVAA